MKQTAWHRTAGLAVSRPAWRPRRLAIDPRAFKRQERNASSLKWRLAMWLARAGVAIPVAHALLHVLEAFTGIKIPHSESVRFIP